MKLLVVEDHQTLGPMIVSGLQNCGFIVDLANCAQQALAYIRVSHYDVMVLDLGLPDMDGMTLLAKQSQQGCCQIPCVVLTARESVDSRVAALNLGADDYLLKPFAMSELEARLRAILRRPGQRRANILTLGNLCFNPINGELTNSDKQLILPKKEAMLLTSLLNSAEQVIIKDQLEDFIYSINESASLNALEALVSRIRRKLKQLQANCFIETIHGVGYRLMLSRENA